MSISSGAISLGVQVTICRTSVISEEKVCVVEEGVPRLRTSVHGALSAPACVYAGAIWLAGQVTIGEKGLETCKVLFGEGRAVVLGFGDYLGRQWDCSQAKVKVISRVRLFVTP